MITIETNDDTMKLSDIKVKINGVKYIKQFNNN